MSSLIGFLVVLVEKNKERIDKGKGGREKRRETGKEGQERGRKKKLTEHSADAYHGLEDRAGEADFEPQGNAVG